MQDPQAQQPQEQMTPSKEAGMLNNMMM